MSLIPGDLLDEKYDSPVAPIPVPTVSEKWGAVIGSDVADMPTAKVLNMMQVDKGEPEQPEILNKRYPGMGFQNPISDQAANNAFSRKQAETQRQDIIARSKWSGWDNFNRGALALTSMIADPVTDALFASTGGIGTIPEALAYRGAAGVVGENFIARGVAGAIGTGTHAAVAGAGLASINQAENVEQGKNIDWRQAAIEEMTIVGMGAGLGSLGKAVAGKASEEVVKWNKIFDGSFTLEEKQAVIKNAASQAMGEVGLQEKDILSMTDKVANQEAIQGRELGTVEEMTQALESENPVPPDRSDPVAMAEYVQRQQQIEEVAGQMQSQKLNNFRDAVESGQFEPKTDNLFLEQYTEKTPTSEPTTFLEDQHKQADEQLSELQKQNNDRIKLEEDPQVQQSLKDRLNEGLDEHVQEMERQQDKRSFLRKSLDCFLTSYAK